MHIRKISIGTSYKDGMHYVLDQEVLGGNYTIHLIDFDIENHSYKLYVSRDDEIFLWKEFNRSLPISIEYNINL